MVKVNGFRPFQRMHNGVLIYLQLDEWPADVPLPRGSTLVETGEGPFHPYWDLVLEPDRTVEVVVGWFIVPPSLDDAIVWYREEMVKRDWVELAEKGYRMPMSAAVHFQHPVTKVRVVVGLRVRPHSKQTDVMIRRVVEHAWPPAEGESAGEPVSELTPVDSTGSLASTGLRRRQLDETAQVEEEPERGEELQVAV